MSLKDEISAGIAAHGQWKVKFREFMQGKLELDAAIVQKNDQCQFGKWLESDGKLHLSTPDYQELHELHTSFHAVAATVIRKKKSGDLVGAQKDLDSGGLFASASAALTRKMMTVK